MSIIRDLALLYDDILEVFEFYADDSQSDLSPRDLKVKSISGLDDTGLCHAKPSSCAQLLSRYSRPGPRLMLQFRQLSRRRPSHPSNTRLTTGPFRLDYTILTSIRNLLIYHIIHRDLFWWEFVSISEHLSRARNELYCSALEGYLRPDLICSNEDRVHCPTSYKPSEGLNPASQADQGFPKREACRTSTFSGNRLVKIFIALLPRGTCLFVSRYIDCRNYPGGVRLDAPHHSHRVLLSVRFQALRSTTTEIRALLIAIL